MQVAVQRLASCPLPELKTEVIFKTPKGLVAPLANGVEAGELSDHHLEFSGRRCFRRPLESVQLQTNSVVASGAQHPSFLENTSTSENAKLIFDVFLSWLTLNC